MDTLDLARALAEHIGAERTTTRELLDLKLGGAEKYFTEHRTKQRQTCVGDALCAHAEKLGIIVYKGKAAKYDLEEGNDIVIDESLGRQNAFSRRSLPAVSR
jgi:hypothetical protein